MSYASTMQLPKQFVKTIQGTFGKDGGDWLEQLPALIQAVERRYDLTVKQPVPNLSFNYVVTAVRSDNTELILKLGVPNKELTSEIASLQLCAGRGSVRLLASDAEQGVLVLERLQPGHSLVSFFPENDDEATRIAANVMQQFWRPVPQQNRFPTVYDWSFGLQQLRQLFDGGVGPFPEYLVDEAENLFAELIPSMDDAVVLHGDLHHDNILAATRQPWLIIDPKGVIGEREYEVVALLRNPIPGIYATSELQQVLERRIAILQEMLGFNRQRMIGWGVAHCVLSAWWSYESDDINWADVLQCADALSNMLNGK